MDPFGYTAGQPVWENSSGPAAPFIERQASFFESSRHAGSPAQGSFSRIAGSTHNQMQSSQTPRSLANWSSGSTAGPYQTADDEMVAVEFTFDVPIECRPGSKCQLRAPDGQGLLIPLPKNVQGGDKVVMALTEEGVWTISHISRPDGAPPSQQPMQPLAATHEQWRSERELREDISAPEGVTVRLRTTKGTLTLRIVPKWAPKGAKRFLQLVDQGFFNKEMPIYRAVSDFLVQFGVVQGGWPVSTIDDDPLYGVPVEAGSFVFAAAGPNSRRHTLCIFLKSFPSLGRKPSEAPIGKLTDDSMEVLQSLYMGYGDIPQAGGTGPDPLLLEQRGNDYIHQFFPRCDFITGASRVQEDDDVCTIA